jgi:hypothetical protein
MTYVFLVISCVKKLNSRDRTNSSVKEISIIIFDTTDFIQKWKGGGGFRGCSAAQANVDSAFPHSQLSVVQ